MVNLYKRAKRIWKDIKGKVDVSEIRQALEEVISKYHTARAQAYVPVYIRRKGMDRLRHHQNKFQ